MAKRTVVVHEYRGGLRREVTRYVVGWQGMGCRVARYGVQVGGKIEVALVWGIYFEIW